MPSPSTPSLSVSSDASSPPAWPRLVLGSTSPYRRELLARLGLPFDVCAPCTDEQAQPGEAPCELAWRLARAKAADVVTQLAQAAPAGAAPDVLVIGSDQVAELDGQALGKPGDHALARAQLRAMSGREVLFHTAVCIKRPAVGFDGLRLCTVRVAFRPLDDADIETYLLAEQPYDCAGSAKAEGLGIVLIERLVSDDPTALIGLPLIETTRLMREAGADPLRWLAALAPSLSSPASSHSSAAARP